LKPQPDQVSGGGNKPHCFQNLTFIKLYLDETRDKILKVFFWSLGAINSH